LHSGLDTLIIALDGASGETLSLYRKNANFSEIVAGIKNITTKKKERCIKAPVVELQFIVMRHNEHEIEKMMKLAMDLGVDRLLLKTVCSYNSPDAQKYLPRKTKFRRIKVDTAGCRQLWKSMTVNWNGDVTPCCVDSYSQYIMGNIISQSVSEIWNSSKYVQFRKANLRHGISLCNRCNSVHQILTDNCTFKSA